MPESLTDFIKAIPDAAASPSAFAAYVVLVLSTFVVSLKTKRNKQLLEHLTAFPEKDRLRALEAEMGTVRVPPGLTPEQWLRSRIHNYLFAGFGAVCVVVLVVTVVALTTKPAEGKLEGDVTLYEPPTNGK
jgi:hypothetical protein